MNLLAFRSTLTHTPATIEFTDTLAVIDELYHFEPVEFSNGELTNLAGDNSGSCKLFAFARLQNLNIAETLACFGHYYRDDVLNHPDVDDHQNIRNFIRSGWAGIHFAQPPLSAKT